MWKKKRFSLNQQNSKEVAQNVNSRQKNREIWKKFNSGVSAKAISEKYGIRTPKISGKEKIMGYVYYSILLDDDVLMVHSVVTVISRVTSQHKRIGKICGNENILKWKRNVTNGFSYSDKDVRLSQLIF